MEVLQFLEARLRDNSQGDLFGGMESLLITPGIDHHRTPLHLAVGVKKVEVWAQHVILTLNTPDLLSFHRLPLQKEGTDAESC